LAVFLEEIPGAIIVGVHRTGFDYTPHPIAQILGGKSRYGVLILRTTGSSSAGPPGLQPTIRAKFLGGGYYLTHSIGGRI
jgi:hypothetical protein